MEALGFRISEAEGLLLAWSTGIKVYTPMSREAIGEGKKEVLLQSIVTSID